MYNSDVNPACFGRRVGARQIILNRTIGKTPTVQCDFQFRNSEGFGSSRGEYMDRIRQRHCAGDDTLSVVITTNQIDRNALSLEAGSLAIEKMADRRVLPITV